MTIRRKGRRDLTVDGVDYHWLVVFEKSERVVIQHASGRGPCLFVFPHAIMKPVHAADAIRFGIRKGWDPGGDGEDRWIAFGTGPDEEGLFEFVPNDDFRVVTYATYGKLPEGGVGKQYPDTRPWHRRPIEPEWRGRSPRQDDESD